MSHGADAIIRLSALQHNLNCVRNLARPSKILAMIKANAYGHGLVPVAKALAQTDAYGVASINEAIILRQANIDKPIVVLSGFYSVHELELFLKFNLETVIHHFAQLEILEKAQISKSLSVWMKIDTGMHRLGFLPEEVKDVYQRLLAIDNIHKPLKMMTHLASADSSED